MQWDKLANDDIVEKTADAIRKRGIEVFIVNSGKEAEAKVLGLIPKGSKVNLVSSTTMSQIGFSKHLEESGDYESLGAKARAISDEKERAEFRKHIMAPEYGVGSVNAITEDGQLIDVSASGSQIPVYSFGADHLVLVASTQKIVKTLDDGLKRVYDYVLPLESERVKDAYKMAGSSVNKILIIEKERPGRTTLILVKEKLGF